MAENTARIIAPTFPTGSAASSIAPLPSNRDRAQQIAARLRQLDAWDTLSRRASLGHTDESSRQQEGIANLATARAARALRALAGEYDRRRVA